jgi:hypothetical protein
MTTRRRAATRERCEAAWLRDQRFAPSGWSIDGAKRSHPVATGGKRSDPEND